MPTWQHYRARLNALQRYRKPDDPEVLEARRDLAEARAADVELQIKALIATAPPIDAEQADRIVALLHSSGGDRDVA